MKVEDRNYLLVSLLPEIIQEVKAVATNSRRGVDRALAAALEKATELLDDREYARPAAIWRSIRKRLVDAAAGANHKLAPSGVRGAFKSIFAGNFVPGMIRTYSSLRRCWEELDRAPTITDVARRAKTTRRTIRRNMALLSKHGIVVKRNGAWIPRSIEDLAVKLQDSRRQIFGAATGSDGR